MAQARIVSLHIYPIKSCGSISLEKVEFGETGLKYDRNWAVIDSRGKLMTQRDNARMALVSPCVSESGELSLSAPGMEQHKVIGGFRSVAARSGGATAVASGSAAGAWSASQNGTHRSMEVWGDSCAGFDEGDEAAIWLSNFLKTDCRLVRFDTSFSRPTKQKSPDGTPGLIAFADCSPLLVVSSESLDDLNRRLETPAKMSCFRPNIVLSGFDAFAEEKYSAIEFPDLTAYSMKPCARCVMVTIDQNEGLAKGPEPLKTLSEYRRRGEKVIFGQYFLAQKAGILKVGDTANPVTTVPAQP